jgi:hypothetical protein
MSLKAWFEKSMGVGTIWTQTEYGIQSDTPPLYTKPHLASVNRAPSREEFARWHDDDVTKFVMAALRRNHEECREEWTALSWGTGHADEKVLIGLRERADALEGFTGDYEAFCETLNLEPEKIEGER